MPRRIGVEAVELSAHCWGGNTSLAYNARTNARILFALLPIDARRTRVYILNVLPEVDRPFIECIKYWKALPPAPALAQAKEGLP